MYVYLFNVVWKSDSQSHGLLVYLIVLFLFFQKRAAFAKMAEKLYVNLFSVGALSSGILLFMLGNSQSIIHFELFSQILILLGLLLLFMGYQQAKMFYFPLFFLIFAIPFPDYILDALTLPMKIAVSAATDSILYYSGLPVGRDGVILQVANYQLLVADACAGMKTLMSLEALGLLYLNLVKHDSLTRNVTLAILIVPISFVANVVRVVSLCLITYYFGDEAGRGFMHNFAGIILFMIALLLTLSVDNYIQSRVEKNAQ